MSLRSQAVAGVLLFLLPSGARGQVGRLTGEVVVRFEGRSEAEPGAFSAVSGDPAVSRLRRLEGRWPMWLLALRDGADPIRVAARLDALDGVRFAEADRWIQVRAAGPAEEPFFAEEWHLRNDAQNDGALPGADIGADVAWELAGGAEGIRIAVLDSGLQLDHPDLLVDTEAAWDAVEGDNDPSPNPEDPGGAHGTCVAGVAAARGDNGYGAVGVAWGATIVPLRIIGNLTSSAMRGAFVRATDAGADVLNNSWGMNDAECSPLPEMETLQDGIDYAATEGRGGLGAVVLFSSGNDGCRSTDYPVLANEHVLGVGSSNDRDEKWPYTVWGPNLDVLAPSGSIGGNERPGLWTTDPVGDYGWNGAGTQNEFTPWFGGTSGAAPVASGVAALMIAANPRIDEASVRRILCDTAVRVAPEVAAYDQTGWSDTHGCGRIDAAAAVGAARNAPPEAPVLAHLERPEGDVWVEWSAVDPDGDALRWDLWLRVPGEEEGEPLVLDQPNVDLSEEASVGDWEVRVRGVDPWGPGPDSGWVPLRVAALPVPDDDEGDACAASFVGPANPGILGVALLLPSRRRRVRAPGRRSRILVFVTCLLSGCTPATEDDTPTPAPDHCGDAEPTGGEGCDDGNPWSGDGCAPDCSVELAQGETEPNDEVATRGTLDGEGMLLAALPAEDRDCVLVETTAGGFIEAWAEPVTPGDVCPAVQIDLLDPDGALVATASRVAIDACAHLDPISAPGARFTTAGAWTLCARGLQGAVVPGYRLHAATGSESCDLPGLPFPSDEDVDEDGAPDRCDDDDDGDGIADVTDLCDHDPDGGQPRPLLPDAEGFLREWLVAGPFVGAASTDACRPSDDLLLGNDPEHVPVLAGPAGDRAWVHYRSPGPRIDFLALMAGELPREVYLGLWLHLPEPQSLTLALGPDDGVRAWIDGVQLLDVAGCQGTNVDQFQAPWSGDAGWHRLLLKVRDQGGAWGVYARFLDGSGVPATDIEISLDAAGTWAPAPADTDGDGVGDLCDPTPAGG